MKRLFLAPLLIGALAAGIVCVLHATGLLFRFEFALTEWLTRGAPVTHMVGAVAHYTVATFLALGVAWVTLASRRRAFVIWLVLALVLELLALPWVFSLYGLFFQPLPAVFAALLSFGLAFGYRAIVRGTRGNIATETFAHHISQEQLERVIQSDFSLGSRTTTHEATVVMCDIGNKHELAADRAPELVARMVDRFVRLATGVFLEAGGYIQGADGEGVVAIFGFPVEDAKHAETAGRAALRIVEAFAGLRASDTDLYDETYVHLGISSGTVIAARFENGNDREVVPIGEPLELARRFAIANRTYGSRILMGPEVFEIAEQLVLARPIDFLSGSATRERFEVYELLMMTEQASPEDIARRDAFWNGVVYFREKRWGEAYAEFQKAWGQNGNEDGPLQLYLRRLEPLVLNLTDDLPPLSETLASH